MKSSEDRTVLSVVHLDHSTERGGAEFAIARLISAQAWKGHLIVPKGPLGIFSELSIDRISECGPQHPPGGSAKSSLAKSIGLAFRIMMTSIRLALNKNFRLANVIHANTTRSSVYGALASKLTRKPLVVHLRDIVSPESLGRLGYLVTNRVVIPSARGLIANSQATLDSVPHSLLKSRKSAIIPSPIGMTRTPEIDISSGKTSLDIGLIARIDPWKGQDLLIRSFSHLVADGFNVRLHFAGSPAFEHDEYLRVLKEMANTLGISEKVTFHGHVDNVPHWIRDMDICVQASMRPEPLGQNVLQYLASGKAVVAANEGGPLSWIRPESNGLLFQARDEKSLYEQLRRLITDVDLRFKIMGGAIRTPELLTDEEVALQHKAFFEEILRQEE